MCTFVWKNFTGTRTHILLMILALWITFFISSFSSTVGVRSDHSKDSSHIFLVTSCQKVLYRVRSSPVYYWPFCSSLAFYLRLTQCPIACLLHCICLSWLRIPYLLYTLSIFLKVCFLLFLIIVKSLQCHVLFLLQTSVLTARLFCKFLNYVGNYCGTWCRLEMLLRVNVCSFICLICHLTLCPSIIKGT